MTTATAIFENQADAHARGWLNDTWIVVGTGPISRARGYLLFFQRLAAKSAA